ncbi:hypothetical protein MRX96_020958 [Rhipicephalus microplus]
MTEAMVDGETITEEEASAPGWIDAIGRRAKHRRNNNQQTQGGSATQQPTPKQPAPTLPTKHLPTTTENPTATPTWAD